VPEFIVIKSQDCTPDQESDITVSLIYSGGATATLMLDAVGALMTGTDADVETADSYVGNGLDQVVLASDEPLATGQARTPTPPTTRAASTTSTCDAASNSPALTADRLSPANRTSRRPARSDQDDSNTRLAVVPAA
jgi:hypothetical protein